MAFKISGLSHSRGFHPWENPGGLCLSLHIGPAGVDLFYFKFSCRPNTQVRVAPEICTISFLPRNMMLPSNNKQVIKLIGEEASVNE